MFGCFLLEMSGISNKLKINSMSLLLTTRCILSDRVLPSHQHPGGRERGGVHPTSFLLM